MKNRKNYFIRVKLRCVNLYETPNINTLQNITKYVFEDISKSYCKKLFRKKICWARCARMMIITHILAFLSEQHTAHVGSTTPSKETFIIASGRTWAFNLFFNVYDTYFVCEIDPITQTNMFLAWVFFLLRKFSFQITFQQSNNPSSSNAFNRLTC